MAGDHNTPIGTPILIAPGKVFLVGEYGVLDEGSAVVAAVPLFAQAQFVPRQETMPPLVSEVVRRARAHLGDMTAALPEGTVQVTTNDFQLGCPTGGLGSSAAISVAAAASIYEALGLDLDERKAEILAIADASRRAAQGEIGSGADTVAATYGGLVEVARSAGAAPALRKLAVPSGMSLVLFSAGPSVSTKQMGAGLAAYAEREKVAFADAKTRLQACAQELLGSIAANDAKQAVRSAGAYGDELAELAQAAGIPIVNAAFGRAATLARQYGGIAKPAAAGAGEIGIALFAAPDAASAFRRACAAPIVPLAAGIDEQGARCQVSNVAAPSSPSHERTQSAAAEDDGFEDDAETVIQGFDAAIMTGTAPAKDTVSASPIEIHTTSVSNTLPSMEPARPLLRRAVLPAATLLAACVAAAWLGLSHQVRRGQPRAATVSRPAPALASDHAKVATPAPELHEPATQIETAQPRPEQGLPLLEPPGTPVETAKPSTEKPRPPVRTARSERRQPFTALRPVPDPSQQRPRAATKSATSTLPRRAGDLSPSDF